MVKPIVSLVKRLRSDIVTRVHFGHLDPGAQLPSYRELSEQWDVDHRMVGRAYRVLEAEGLVDIRGRSGVFLAEQEHLGGELPAETAQWVAREVLAEAWLRRIKIPELPELIRKCTVSVKLRTACIESTEDHRYLLCHELRDWFGFETAAVSATLLPEQDPGCDVAAVLVDTLPREVRDADLLVTTRFHVHQVRPLAAALGKPHVAVSMHTVAGDVVQGRLRKGPLVVVCVDPAFGDRMKVLAGSEYQDRLRVVLARDRKALSELDPETPVFISNAASAQLDSHPPSILRDVPAFSAESAADLAHSLIRLNLEPAHVSR